MSGMARSARDESGERRRPPLRDVRLWHPDVEARARGDGTIYVRQKSELGPYPEKLTQRLVHWAEHAPDRVHLAARETTGTWRKLTYAQTFETTRRLGKALLRYDLSTDRPLVILSENDIEHALLGLAAYHVGIPYAPIAPAYAIVSRDFQRLRDIFELLKPWCLRTCRSW
jgi:feruloyl-CoA synthase